MLSLKKLQNHIDFYKKTNPSRYYLGYFLHVITLRFLNLTLAVLLLPIYAIVYPILPIRFVKLIGSSIGHFASTTELLLNTMTGIKDNRYFNIFYIETTPFQKSISNQQLYKMWKRKIYILPLSLSGIANELNKMLMFFFQSKAYGLYGEKHKYECRYDRDIKGYLKKNAPLLSFTQKEIAQAHSILRNNFNMDENAKYVCLLVRTNDYNNGHPTWHFPERNADVKTYVKACLYLADQGYYVMRMGRMNKDSLSINHPRVIDYSKSTVCSDFMDIYLSANCHFFISTSSGLDSVAQIFRRPILYTNFLCFPALPSWSPNNLAIFKHWLFKSKNQPLTLYQQIYYFYLNKDYLFRTGFHVSDYLDQYDLQFQNNSEDEILDAVQEMEQRLLGNVLEQTELQKSFWDAFRHYSIDHPCQWHGELDIKIGSNFLKRYQEKELFVLQ